MKISFSCVPKCFISIKSALLFTVLPANAEAVSMTADQWAYRREKVQFIEYKGKAALRALPNSGQVVLKNVAFTNGTIEFDILPDQPDFVSLFFRRMDENESEIVYLRTWGAGKPNAPDTLQYSPMVRGVTLWDLFGHYQTHCNLHTNDWNRIKLVISGAQLRVFVNDMKRPALEIPRLEGTAGGNGLAVGGNAFFADLEVGPSATEELPPTEGIDPAHNDNRYLRYWQTTQPTLLPVGRELVPADFPKADADWKPIEAERRGLINLTREFGKSMSRRAVWLRVKMRTEVAMERRFDLGFSDEVWVFLNGALAYVDKNLYRQPVAKSPDGRCSIENASFKLPLKAGDNEVLIGVANDFYGWGIVARLDRLDGVAIIR